LKADHKVIMFFLYSQFMLGCRYLFTASSRRTPADVSRVEDFNQEFLSKVSRDKVQLDIAGLVPVSAEDIDVSLQGPNFSPKETLCSRSFSILGRL